MHVPVDPGTALQVQLQQYFQEVDDDDDHEITFREFYLSFSSERYTDANAIDTKHIISKWIELANKPFACRYHAGAGRCQDC